METFENDCEYRVCVIKDCDSRRPWNRAQKCYLKKGGKVFFRFPMDPVKRNRWIRAIISSVRPCDIRTLYDEKVESFICEDHFNLEHDMLNYVQFKAASNIYVPMVLKGDIVPMMKLKPQYHLYNDTNTNYPHLMEHNYSLTIFILNKETEESKKIIPDVNEASYSTSENVTETEVEIKSELYFESEDYHFWRESNFETNKMSDGSETLSVKSFEIIQCDFCSQEFCYKSDLLHHIEANHLEIGPEEYHCSQCPSSFVNENTFLDHVRIAHCKLSTDISDVVTSEARLSNNFNPLTKSGNKKKSTSISQEQDTETKVVTPPRCDTGLSQVSQINKSLVPTNVPMQSYIDPREIYPLQKKKITLRKNNKDGGLKVCYIPTCNNNSVLCPDKLFFKVPKMVKRWFTAANREFPKERRRTAYFCCEDHFDLKEDAILQGGELILKKNVLPHKLNEFYKRNIECKQQRTCCNKRKRDQLNQSLKVDHDESANQGPANSNPRRVLRKKRNEAKTEKSAEYSDNSQSSNNKQAEDVSPVKGEDKVEYFSSTIIKEIEEVDRPQYMTKGFDLDKFEKHEENFKTLLDGMARMRKKEEPKRETNNRRVSLVASHKDKALPILKEGVIKLERINIFTTPTEVNATKTAVNETKTAVNETITKNDIVKTDESKVSRKSFDLQDFEQHEQNYGNILNHEEEEDVFVDNALLKPLKVIKEEVIDESTKCLTCPALIPNGHVLCQQCKDEQIINAVLIDDESDATQSPNADVDENNEETMEEVEPKKTRTKRGETKRRTCEHCQREFRHYKSWYDHMQIMHGVKKFCCEVCGEKFACKRYLIKHNNVRHLGVRNKSNKPVNCSVCFKEFRNNDCMQHHYKNCHSASVECEICHTVVKSAEYLKSHLRRVHSVTRSCPCESCGKVFRNQRQLYIHIRNQHPDTMKKCHYCPKLFNSSVLLERHLTECIQDKIEFEIKIEPADSDCEDWCIK